MADKYGQVDAHFFFFECTLDGEDVGPYCTRGNDIDGWVDLLPVDDEGKVISFCPERHRGEIVFSDVRPTNTGAFLISHLAEDIHDLKERLAKLRIDYRGMRDTIHELVSDVEELASAHQSPEPRADRGGPIVGGGDEVVASQERFE